MLLPGGGRGYAVNGRFARGSAGRVHPIVLCACYAMPGTDGGDIKGHVVPETDESQQLWNVKGVHASAGTKKLGSVPIVPRPRYAMSGSDRRYAAIRSD
eukprot:3287741-Rhodomonas_salina.3